MIKRIIILFLFTIISLFLFNIKVEASTDGQIIVNKTENKSNETYDRSTNVELSIKANSYMKDTTTDIVLVLDRSKSMDGKKWIATKDATNNLIDSLFNIESSNLRVGIVTFANDVIEKYSSNLTTNKTNLNNIINSIPNPSSYTGTNIASGISKASSMLESSTASNKIVILLSDGEPNCYTTENGKIIWNTTKAINNTKIEANNLKTKATLYTIGFETDNNAKTLLKAIATDESKFYESSTTEINNSLKTIFAKINVVATNIKIEDYIPKGFSIDSNTLPTNCKVILDSSTKLNKLTCNINEINSLNEYIIKYKLNTNKNYYGSMNTNIDAVLYGEVLENNPYYNKTNIQETFPIPTTVIPLVTNNDSYNLTSGNKLNVNIKSNDELNNKTIDNNATVVDDIIIVDDKGNEINLPKGININNDGTLTYSSNYNEEKTISFNYYIKTTITINNKTRIVKSNTSKVTIDIKKLKVSYVVKYLEEGTQKKLAEEKVVNNKYLNDEVTEEAKNIEDYMLTSEKIKTINLKENNNVIIFCYAKPKINNEELTKTGTQIIEHSLDKISYDINYKNTIDNYKGTAVLTVTDILPYEIDVNSSELAGGIYNENDKTITWKVTIDNIDTFKNKEAKEINFSKNIKVVYKDMDPTKDFTNKVNAYIHLLKDGDSKEDEAKTEVNIKGNLIVKYLDENNNELLVEKKSTEKVGTEYTTNSNEVEGYLLKEVKGSEKGFYIEGDIIVKYIYSKIKPKLEDSFIKKTGDVEITKSNSLVNYKINYNSIIKDYKGNALLTIIDYLPYKINKEESDLDNGIYNESNKTITWYFNINDINTFKENIDSFINKEINIKLKFIDFNKEDTKIINNVKGILKLENLIDNKESNYETNININGNVIVKYLDKEGNKIEQTEIFTNKVGLNYQTTNKEIKGYKLLKINGNEFGKYTENNINIEYIYEKVPVIENEVEQITYGNSPQTGVDENNSLFFVIMFGIINVLLISFRKKLL